MGCTWGNNIKISIFGESHGTAIGINIDGIKPGFKINFEELRREMCRRAPGKNKLSTSRCEFDDFEILSGYFEDKTTGTPLCAIIKNNDKKSKDYSKFRDLARPGHADFTGHIKYKGFNDYRGGGHFSGRLTAPLVFCGAILKQILKTDDIIIGSHIKQIYDIKDSIFDCVNISKEKLLELSNQEFPVLDVESLDSMQKTILDSKHSRDSVGGAIEFAVVGLKPGIGDPFFNSVESILSHLLFSIPAVKGVEFGQGFGVCNMLGSKCNDEYYYNKNGKILTKTNNNGGILGGITNGMPLIGSVSIKPTPSISKLQHTVNFKTKTNETISINGRHDPCIVQRAIPVVEAVLAIGIYDFLKEDF